MKKITTIIGIMIACGAFATDEGQDIATSQAYVENELANRQDTIQAKSGDKVVVATGTKGQITERDIKITLGNEEINQSDNGITTVGTVKAAIDDKQKKIQKLPDGVNIVTYTGTNNDSYATGQRYGRGVVTTTPIYDENVNTYANGLVRAETLNSAVQRGVSRAFTKTAKGFQINNIGNVLPTTAYLPTDSNGLNTCYKRLSPLVNYPDRWGECSSTLYNDMERGDWGVVMPYETGITYNGTCTGNTCNREIRGISACGGYAGVNGVDNQVPNNYSEMLDTIYLNSKTTGESSGPRCYCRVSSPIQGMWVAASISDADHCARICAYLCVKHASDYISKRTLLFSAKPVNQSNE